MKAVFSLLTLLLALPAQADRLPLPADTPPAYRADRYRITNYSYYRLPPPPRGYYYTRVDNDVILTAAATGVIASVIVGMFQ